MVHAGLDNQLRLGGKVSLKQADVHVSPIMRTHYYIMLGVLRESALGERQVQSFASDNIRTIIKETESVMYENSRV